MCRAYGGTQGYVIGTDGTLILPDGTSPKMSVPTELVPLCPKCGKPMCMKLRADDTFVEDEGWHRAAERYSEFLRRHKNTKVLFLEAAVGYNTPTIVKYSFWRMVHDWKDTTYACLNYGEAYAPPLSTPDHEVAMTANLTGIKIVFLPWNPYGLERFKRGRIALH